MEILKSNPFLERTVILFDGNCNLCNKSVQFILKNERAPELHFASLQSDFSRTILTQFSLPEEYTDSVLLYEKGHLYRESEAAIRIATYLRAPWSWARALRLVPTSIRDWIYRRIAKNRLLWFGATESCWIVHSVWDERFISDSK
jgi:predicted DCC family thiol-disulfide oxidoreductase YuxK